MAEHTPDAVAARTDSEIQSVDGEEWIAGWDAAGSDQSGTSPLGIPLDDEPVVSRVRVSSNGARAGRRRDPASPSDERGRYPHLTWYLAFLTTGVRATAVFAVIAVSVMFAFWFFLSGTNPSMFSFLFFYVPSLIAIGITYLAYMAAVEFVRVVIDIEESARTLAEAARNGPSSED